MAKIVIGLYDDFADVNNAIREILDRGYKREDISIIANDAERRYSQYLKENQTVSKEQDSGAEEGASVGAGIGAVVGGLAGILAGIGALVIPVVGPVIAAGPLAAAITGLAGAGVGALAGGVTGGLVGALIDVGVPEETANYYAEGIRRGGTLVAVRVEDQFANEVREILNKHNPTNISERASEWRDGSLGDFIQPAYYENNDENFRRNFESSPYAHQFSYEEFRPVYYYGYGLANQPQYQERRWEDVETDIRKDWEQRNYGTWEQYRDSIRYGWNQAQSHGLTTEPENVANPRFESISQDVGQDLMTDTASGPRNLNEYNDAFRQHFMASPYSQSSNFDQYMPAYHLGYELGTNPSHTGRNWTELEPVAQSEWERRGLGTWEQYRDAVQYGWQQARGGQNE